MRINTLIQLSGSRLTIFTAWSSAQGHISMFRTNLRLSNLALHPLMETHLPPSSSSLHFSPSCHCLAAITRTPPAVFFRIDLKKWLLMAGSCQYWKHCSWSSRICLYLKFKGHSGQGFIMGKLSCSSCFDNVCGIVNTSILSISIMVTEVISTTQCPAGRLTNWSSHFLQSSEQLRINFTTALLFYTSARPWLPFQCLLKTPVQQITLPQGLRGVKDKLVLESNMLSRDPTVNSPGRSPFSLNSEKQFKSVCESSLKDFHSGSEHPHLSSQYKKTYKTTEAKSKQFKLDHGGNQKQFLRVFHSQKCVVSTPLTTAWAMGKIC